MNVKIYTTKFCPWCQRAKGFFKENRVKYKEIDVGSDLKAAKEMIEKSGQQGVPVIEVDKKIIVGFDESALRKAIKI